MKALHIVEGDRGLMKNPNRPAPTRFQNATATKKKMGHRYAATQGRAWLRVRLL